MVLNRNQKAKLNILISLASQVVTLLCGLIVPGLMIRAFGSEAYGATTSIAQFLSYIALLEGGIGGVARAALYKPLAEENTEVIGAVVGEIKRFFRVVGLIFAAYVLVLAFSYKSISNIQIMDWATTAVLVVAISISTFAQYFIGISNSVLLQAAQMSYVTQGVSIAATIVNTILVVILIRLEASLLMVKLMSSTIFVLRPVALELYVRKRFRLRRINRAEKSYLTQKWDGLGQHIAYFLHSNTDVVILTCFADLKAVAVYSVYHMIVGHMQSLTSSFSAGMEALFGDMLAKQEMKELNKTLNRYEMIISLVSVVLFATTSVLIRSFVRLYTAGVTDANYHAPLFSVLLVVSALLYCLRMPYHSMVIAAGHFKQTRMAAYGEALINVFLSILLVREYGLVGVAIGTVLATGFRFVYYAYYLSRNILNRPAKEFIKRIVVNAASFMTAYVLGSQVIGMVEISNYPIWAVCGMMSVLICSVVVLGINMIAFRDESRDLLKRFIGPKT